MTRTPLLRLLAPLIAAALASSAFAWPAFAAGPAVRAEGGAVILASPGGETRLTSSGRDTDPVLTPDGKAVIYTRLGRAEPATARPTSFDTGCHRDWPADELRLIAIDGSGDRL